MSRDSALGLIFAGVNYLRRPGLHGAQEALGVKSAKELNGASVCVQTGTTTELNLADYFKANKMTYKPVVFEKLDEVNAAYDAGRCDVYTTDQSGLYAHAPAACATRTTTSCCPRSSPRSRWARRCARATTSGSPSSSGCYFALLNAEELGVTQANVDEMLKSTNPEIKRLLGKEGEFGKGHRPRQRLGRATSSRRSATTARSSSATWARTRRSRSPAASTTSGTRAASSTPRRSASDSYESAGRRTAAGALALRVSATRGGRRHGCRQRSDRQCRSEPRRARSSSSIGPRCARPSSRSSSSSRSSPCSGCSSPTRRPTCSAQNIASGFGFLDRTAGFDISQTLIDYRQLHDLRPRLPGRAAQHAAGRRHRHRLRHHHRLH